MQGFKSKMGNHLPILMQQQYCERLIDSDDLIMILILIGYGSLFFVLFSGKHIIQDDL